jgi:MOSC domain-containing protein YiiM
MRDTTRVRHIFISPGHNYIGHHGREPDAHPVVELESVECVAGQGLRGDRYFGHKVDFKGQVTFFAWEVYEAVRDALGTHDKPPSLLRRNVVTQGVDLGSLVGRSFELQGISFFGTEECKPCYWMDRALTTGAEAALRGRGGLRAIITSSGTLSRTP